MLEGRSASYAENFRKLFQKVIQYPGKAREFASRVFGEKVLEAGGVRFFVKYEQLNQIATQGVDKIMSQILPTCKTNGWSEGSTEKMLTQYNGEENCAHRGMAMLEISAAPDQRKICAESCYSLEGDSAVISRGSSVFKGLEDTIVDGCDLLKINEIVDAALQLILKDKNRLSDKKIIS